MKRPANLLILVAVLFTVLLGLGGLRNVGPWLVSADPVPDSLDVIFTFAGENARITYSKALFRRHPASRWIISYPNRRITLPLDKEGLDTGRILVVDTCRNTFSEIDFLARWIAEQPNCGTMNIGLVSAPYHMRRIRLTMARRVRNKCECPLSFLAFPSEGNTTSQDQYRRWWKDKNTRFVVFSELKKIAYYWWKY